MIIYYVLLGLFFLRKKYHRGERTNTFFVYAFFSLPGLGEMRHFLSKLSATPLSLAGFGKNSGKDSLLEK